MKTPLSETPRKSRREISLSFFRREFRSIMQHPASAINPSLRPSSDAPYTSSGNAIVALFSRNFPRCFSVSRPSFLRSSLSTNAECSEGGKRHITGNCGHPTDAASLSLLPSLPAISFPSECNGRTEFIIAVRGALRSLSPSPVVGYHSSPPQRASL